MAISVQNRKILWGLSGNRCAFPGCNQLLHLSIGDSGSSLVGEECHIEAQNENGPRYNPMLSQKQINDYRNLILLCPKHHKIVDDNPEEYPVGVLIQMKANHEARVRRALEDKTENDDMHYEAVMIYVDMMLDFENWEEWTSYLLNAQPITTTEKISDIEVIHKFIISRIWPQRYLEVEDAFKNFDTVLWDFYKVFFRHAESQGLGYRTVKFYRTYPYDYHVANQLLPLYKRHVFLVNTLVVELTKAGNYLCDMIRKCVDSGYRMAEGKLMIHGYCPEYDNEKKYFGLDEVEKMARLKFPAGEILHSVEPSGL